MDRVGGTRRRPCSAAVSEERDSPRRAHDLLARPGIPLASRVLHAADMLEAMTSSRVYRPGQPVDFALFEIGANAGSQLDPTVAATLAQLLRSGRLVVPANATAPGEPVAAEVG